MSKNIKKKVWHFFLNLLLVILALPPAISLLFKSPTVQTISAKMAAHVASELLHQHFEIERIQVDLFTGITIKEMNLRDDHGQVLIGMRSMKVMPIFGDILTKQLIFRSVKLEGATFNMGSYKGDSVSNLNAFLQGVTGNSGSSSGGGTFKLIINKLQLTNSHFHLFSEEDITSHDSTMDYNDIKIDSINLDIRHFHLINDSLHFVINDLHANEQSGITVNSLKTIMTISSRGILFDKLLLEAGTSRISGSLGMHTRTWNSYSEFIDSVYMTGTFAPTTINMADLGYFSAIMYRMPNTIGLTGQISGTVANLNARNARITFGKHSLISGNMGIKGLPDFFTSYMTGDSLEVHLTTEDLRQFKLPVDGISMDFTSYYPAGKPLIITGTFLGEYENFKTKLKISTYTGSLTTDIRFLYRDKDTTAFNLVVKTDSLNVGQLLGLQDYLGRTSLYVKADGNGKTPESMRINGKGKLTRSMIMGHNLQQVTFKGNYKNKLIKAEVGIADPELTVHLNAELNNQNEPDLKFDALVAIINLKELGILEAPPLELSTSLSGHAIGFDPDKMTAHLKMNNTDLFSSNWNYHMDSLMLSKEQDSLNNTVIKLDADPLELNVDGQFQLSTISTSLIDYLNNYYHFAGREDVTEFGRDEQVNFQCTVHDPLFIENLFLKDVHLGPAMEAHGSISLKQNKVMVNAYLPKVAYSTMILDSNTIHISNDIDDLIIDYQTSDIILKDSTPEDPQVFGLDNFSISARIGQDSIVYGINWDNVDTIHRNEGDIRGYIQYQNDTTTASIGMANLYINDSLWSIDTTNLIKISSDYVSIRRMKIKSERSLFDIHGVIPRVEGDTLTAKFEHWNLSVFDILTQPHGIDLNGEMNGLFQATRMAHNPAFVSDLTIYDLALNNEYLGKARLLNTWDNTNNAVFLKSQILREGNSGTGEVFSADGYYYPFRDNDNLDLNVSFNRIKLKSFEPFLSDFVSEIEGSTSGNLTIAGSLSNPELQGNAKLQRTSMIVNYLNTRYSFSNQIDFNKNSIGFDNLVLYDTLGNRADVSGKLLNPFSANPDMKVEVNTDRLLFFNTTKEMNDLYYGKAIASGKILLTGSPSDIHLSINSSTQKGTMVTLPLTSSVEISDKDYIIFVNKTDSLLVEQSSLRQKENQGKQSRFDIKLDLGVTPDAGVSIFLPSDMGNIEARGAGELYMEVNSEGDFNLTGDYVVESGTFLFTIGNLVNKRFSLVRGGRISWTGSPYTANVNIQGLYRVKTNLQSLGIEVDSTANYKNKVTVNCYIALTNELLNPDIKFKIAFPDLDPDMQRMVFAQLDTTNAAMMNQQMISLLVLGTFSFNNAANINLAGSYYGIIANQLSNMLSQISDAFDIGVNYKPGDAVSQEEFEVALSTQLFDNRLTIDGNFGMTYNRSQQSASNLVGDINIGYKLTPDGRWILKVFNHSNVNSWYNSSNYDQISPYTQGVGIAFRKEFNKLAHLFTNTRKRERLQQEADKEKKNTGEGTVSESTQKK